MTYTLHFEQGHNYANYVYTDYDYKHPLVALFEVDEVTNVVYVPTNSLISAQALLELIRSPHVVEFY